jgi:hypothetical protein
LGVGGSKERKEKGKKKEKKKEYLEICQKGKDADALTRKGR